MTCGPRRSPRWTALRGRWPTIWRVVSGVFIADGPHKRRRLRNRPTKGERNGERERSGWLLLSVFYSFDDTPSLRSARDANNNEATRKSRSAGTMLLLLRKALDAAMRCYRSPRVFCGARRSATMSQMLFTVRFSFTYVTAARTCSTSQSTFVRLPVGGGIRARTVRPFICR